MGDQLDRLKCVKVKRTIFLGRMRDGLVLYWMEHEVCQSAHVLVALEEAVVVQLDHARKLLVVVKVVADDPLTFVVVRWIFLAMVGRKDLHPRPNLPNLLPAVSMEQAWQEQLKVVTEVVYGQEL
jgi:hypothetical protein